MSQNLNEIPVEHSDPVNAAILSVSEDSIQGFRRRPFHDIAEKSGVPLETVLERLKAMLEGGVIRRIRQTLLANRLAEGALVAWDVPVEKLDSAFDFLFQKDPFSGHVVLRSTDREIVGSNFKLWTTLKVPQGESLEHHADVLKRLIGARDVVLMPAHGIFALGVGHVRRRTLEIGEKSDEPARMMLVSTESLSDLEWKVLLSLKAELTVDEIAPDVWARRAEQAGLSFEDYSEVAEELDKKRVIGRFSTFLEHVKPSQAGERVTRFNGLFHWRVPAGMQERAGAEVGRHHILTHCYWREGGDRFGNVNIMAVAHGMDKPKILEHKAAIDAHLESVGIPVLYTNVFWGGRSEIKPSEISPVVYRQWHAEWDGRPGPVI